MNVNSYWEKNKFILPIATGLLIWTIVFSIFLFTDVRGQGHSILDDFLFDLILSSLIVGVPTCIFEIVFVFIFKVVKMKPKSSYDIGNINDYISLQERFRSGDYEYETINSNEDIFRSYERGKKIVFTLRYSRKRLFIWMGMIFIIAGLVVSSVLVNVFSALNFPLNIVNFLFLFIFSLSTGVGAMFIISGFFRSRGYPRSFFILAPEGVVYRGVLGGVRSYSWKELDFKVYSVTTTFHGPLFLKMELLPTKELHILLPNGSHLKFDPYDYNLDEFFSFKKFGEKLREKSLTTKKNIKIPASIGLRMEQTTFTLVILAFQYYSYAAKGGDFKKDQIYNYLVRNSRKSYTVKAIFDRINEIDLSEKMIHDLDMNTIEHILEDLFVNRKIRRKDKEGMKFYFF